MADHLPVVTGVYLLFLRHELVYVGRSTNCYRRIAEHRSHGKPFDYSVVAACPAEDARWMEAALVASWAPRQNRAQPALGAVAAKVVTIRADDPPIALSMAKARQRALDCGVSTARLREAIASGEVPNYPRHPNLPSGRGSVRLVPQKALDDWCRAQQDQRLAG